MVVNFEMEEVSMNAVAVVRNKVGKELEGVEQRGF